MIQRAFYYKDNFDYIYPVDRQSVWTWMVDYRLLMGRVLGKKGAKVGGTNKQAKRNQK